MGVLHGRKTLVPVGERESQRSKLCPVDSKFGYTIVIDVEDHIWKQMAQVKEVDGE